MHLIINTRCTNYLEVFVVFDVFVVLLDDELLEVFVVFVLLLVVGAGPYTLSIEFFNSII